MNSKFGTLAEFYGRYEIDLDVSQLCEEDLAQYIVEIDREILNDIKNVMRHNLNRAGSGFGGGMSPSRAAKISESVVEEATFKYIANHLSNSLCDRRKYRI